MKKLVLLLFLFSLFNSCDSKKESLIDSQKLINKQLTGLADSLQHVSDSVSYNRIKKEIHILQLRFDSLNNELNNLKK
jgi:hypothetical protein